MPTSTKTVAETKELTLEECKAQLKQAQTERDNAIAERDESLELIDELKQELAAARKGQAVPTVTDGTDTYQVLTNGFRFKGKLVTYDDLKDDEGLVAQLVAAKTSYLQKVETPARKSVKSA